MGYPALTFIKQNLHHTGCDYGCDDNFCQLW